MAHELAHIKNRDTLTMGVAATIGGAISMFAQWLQLGMLFGGNRDNGGGPGFLASLVAMLVAPFAAMLVLMAALGAAAAFDLITDWAALLLDLLVGVYAANAASDWIITARERQGMTAMATMPGLDEDEALARFAHHWMEGQITPSASVATGPAIRAPQGPVIGLVPESGGR